MVSKVSSSQICYVRVYLDYTIKWIYSLLPYEEPWDHMQSLLDFDLWGNKAIFG